MKNNTLMYDYGGINMKKIVYFDEGSVTDYMQIVQEGSLVKTTELLSQTQKGLGASVGADIKLSPFASLLTAIAGLSANFSGKINMSTSYNTDKMAQTIIQNTLLSDFLTVCKAENSQIENFSGFTLSEPKGSLTELLKISAYTNMMNGRTLIDTSDEIELNIEKFNETIKMAKGYFEFLGVKEERKVIFRFNIEALRNNYRSIDLTRMDLLIYGVQVGKVSLNQLNFNEEIKLETGKEEQLKFFKLDNIMDGEKDKKSGNITESGRELEMFDVFLAGVI